jgi:hypothetical protein
MTSFLPGSTAQEVLLKVFLLQLQFSSEAFINPKMNNAGS